MKGYPNDFSRALNFIHSKNGKCLDCNWTYNNCECEFCNDCEFNRCLCNLGIKRQTYYSSDEKNKIQIEGILLAYKYLEPLEFRKLIRQIDDTSLLGLFLFAKKYLNEKQYILFKEIM